MARLKKSILENLLVMMLKIRKFELAVEKNFQKGHIYGTAHLAIGQEAAAAGSILALKKEDIIPVHTGGTDTVLPRGLT